MQVPLADDGVIILFGESGSVTEVHNPSTTRNTGKGQDAEQTHRAAGLRW